MTTTATKERPILFSGPMVRAILDGRKTQTRRVCKVQWAEPMPPERAALLVAHQCPYAPGQRLWVRETWAHIGGTDVSGWLCYRADINKRQDTLTRVRTWRPSIHMPRWVSRITLEVTGVRLERVQDISEADVAAEGCDNNPQEWNEDMNRYGVARSSFAALWDSINIARGYGWEGNPWVWVVEFKRVQP